MRVQDVMTEGVITVSPASTAEDAWELMRNKGVRHLVVTNEGRVVGVLTNVGSEHCRKLTSPLGFLSGQIGADQVRGDIRREMERRFTPEFLNRIDEIAVFNPLTPGDVR